jgi:hypothetical protein
VAGTSLVRSTDVPDGSTWQVTVRTWDCGEAPCALDADGSPPGDEDPTPSTCETTFRVDGPTLATVGLFGSVDQPECGASTGGPVPALTVPTAFTLRPSYPWDCGSGVGAVGGSDGDTDVGSWDCLAGALSGGDPVELVVVEPRARGVSARSWWRAGEDEGLVIFREPRSAGGPPGTAELDRWTVQECTSLVEAPDGPPGTRTSAGCTEPTEVDLVYDGPEGRAEPSGPAPPAPSLDLVVVGADAADVDPTSIERWVLTDDGVPVASGPIDAAATSLGGWDLPLAGRLTIRWDTHRCEVACSPASPAGTPVDGGSRVETRCEREVPPGAERVVARFQSVDGAPGGAMCDVTPVADVPPLTVPPEWSLRERYASSCRAEAGAPTPALSGCLAQAFADGEQVELESTEGDGRRIVWRVAAGVVTVTRPPTADEPGWTVQTCTGLALISPAAPPYLAPEGCGPREPMPLDPP